jgi:uncharacterized protein
MLATRLPAPRLPVLATLDRVWLAIGAILVAVSLLAPAQALVSLGFVARALAGTGPFLLLAVLAAAYAKASGADNLIARAFQGRLVPMTVLAALVGALSPFCSCGVIPLIAALLAMGVPLPPVMAFWLASPLMDPSMFVLTAAVLGTPFALFKTAAAVGVGLLGGFGTLVLMRTGAFSSVLRPEVGDGGCAGSRVRAPKAVVWRFWDEPARRATFGREAGKTFLFLLKWLTLAFVLESLMVAYVPASWIAVLADGGWTTILLASLIGVPAYLNGYAALPLVGGLIGQGMAPGAAMAFLIAGGVTSLPAAIAVFAVARRPVFFAYLAFALSGAVLAGLAYGLLA